MTTYYPISFTVPQYEITAGTPASGYVLKAYSAGTSTNISMATDYTGATTAATITLNAAGYPAVSGNVVIPHLAENFKLALYPDAASAAANTGALWTVDNIQVAQNSNAQRYLNYATDTGSANAYVIAPDPSITAYAAGQLVTLKPANANTGASTITVNGLATKNIKLKDGTNPAANAMIATGVYDLMYDGTNFVLMNPEAVSAVTGPGYASGNYHQGLGWSGGGGATTLTVTANRLYAKVFVCLSSETFTKIGIEVTTGAGTNARLGIYSSSNGRPGSLLLDAGTVSTATTGEKEVTISQALPAGTYFLGAVFDNTPIVRAVASTGPVMSALIGATDPDNTTALAGFYVAHAFGALPSTFGSVTNVTGGGGGVPAIWVRK